MKITPVIQGNIARNCHPSGCRAAVQQQIDYVHQQPGFTGPKRALILGASSGFGLASRIALTFGCDADTLGVSFEKGPSEKGLGTAGWYNNIFFREAAENQGRKALNIIGDAFSASVQQQIVEAIKRQFGQLDMVIYSLATGRRDDPVTGQSYRSVLKTMGEPFSGYSINLETDSLDWISVETASPEELTATAKVMGGEGWQQWIDLLLAEDLLATGSCTIAYSYIGPALTDRIYRRGTIGVAKEHLHATANHLHEQLGNAIGGSAYPVVCKALVTKASVFIPVMSVYNALLMKQLKQADKHEQCIQQCHRLFQQKLFAASGVQVDENHQIRIDDWELAEAIQRQIKQVYPQITPDNFRQLTDYTGYKQEFLQMNGFAVEGVDYEAEVDVDALIKLKP
jgi:enoyl-[acyl-carrier protein] reductase/trans-2-enoyl-CoA reductase (NAD+)